MMRLSALCGAGVWWACFVEALIEYPSLCGSWVSSTAGWFLLWGLVGVEGPGGAWLGCVHVVGF